MVSLEDEMKQKDKEAAVLKANHKYEMLLNIELERIEKCKRTYENFHNFEVAVMKNRQNRIVQKQYDLKVQKNLPELVMTDAKQELQGSKSQSKMRANEQCLSSNTKTNSKGISDGTGNIHDMTYTTKSLIQAKNTEYTTAPMSRELEERLNLRRMQYIKTAAQYANDIRTRTNVSGMRHADKQNSERDYFRGNAAQIIKSSSFEDAVKFPILQSVSPPSHTTANSATSTAQRHTHFPENLTETNTIHSRDDHRTPSTVSKRKKKSHRRANDDNLSSFDQYRLRLQESEQRARKPKHHHRAISAMDSSSGRNTDDTLMAVRRARSADIQ